MPQLHPLTFLPHALVDAGYQSPGYQSLFEAAQSGWIPAEQSDNGRWLFDLTHVGVIADCLMLDPIAA